MSLGKRQYALIAVARKTLGMGEAEYRAALAQLCGVTSATELDAEGFELLLAFLEWRGVSPGAPRGEDYGRAARHGELRPAGADPHALGRVYRRTRGRGGVDPLARAILQGQLAALPDARPREEGDPRSRGDEGARPRGLTRPVCDMLRGGAQCAAPSRSGHPRKAARGGPSRPRRPRPPENRALAFLPPSSGVRIRASGQVVGPVRPERWTRSRRTDGPRLGPEPNGRPALSRRGVPTSRVRPLRWTGRMRPTGPEPV